MPKDSKKFFLIALLFLLVFLTGFELSSGIFSNIIGQITNNIISKVKTLLDYHILCLHRVAQHYFLLPDGWYIRDFYDAPLSFLAVIIILSNALFNSIFQPIFFCIFTPQVVLIYILFPFFLYGSVKYFKRVPLLILAFFVISLYIALYGSVIEALIRHRLACEMIYLLIGLAGFTDWITKSL